MSPRRLPPPLVALTPGRLASGDTRAAAELIQRVRSALEGGLGGVLVREPGLGDRELLALTSALSERYPALWLGLHDRAHLVAASGVAALHLGGRSLRPAEVRPWLPADVAVGLSTHATDEANDEANAWATADYLFHGPVYATPKPFEHPEIGLAGLAACLARTQVPVWALGGIGPAEVADVLAAGARGTAVLRGILAQDDPGAAAAAYCSRLPAG